jgi:pimeloyl-ACP methyl ester carboxylesterase
MLFGRLRNTHVFGGAVVSLAASCLVCGCSGAPESRSDEHLGATESALTPTDVSFTVAIRGTGTSTIHGHVYSNPSGCGAVNVLAVHGLSETGFTFAPLAQAIFADHGLSLAVKNVIAIDLPGHGDSTFPVNLPPGTQFGDLLVEDYAGVVIQAVDALKPQGLATRVVLTHSMGGLDLQTAQQQLLSAGSSLAAHGVLGAILMAPVPPHGQMWVHANPGDFTPFLVNDPTLGTYLLITPPVFLGLAFSTTAGTIVSNAPSIADVTNNRYIGPEPINVVLELNETTVPLPDGGTFTFQRPTVSAGAFSVKQGTVLSIVSFSEDVLVPAVNLGPLYEYLTGDTHDVLYKPVVAPDAVHGMYISDPTGMLDALRASF